MTNKKLYEIVGNEIHVHKCEDEVTIEEFAEILTAPVSIVRRDTSSLRKQTPLKVVYKERTEK